MLDPTAIERAEKSLDEFINSRSKAKDKANAEADLWRASARAHQRRKQEANRLAWVDYHQGQAERLRATLEALVSKHEAAAARLLEEAGGGGGR